MISLYYYLQVIRQMYIESASSDLDSGEADGESTLDTREESTPEAMPELVGLEGFSRARLAGSPSILLLGVLFITLAAVFWIGVYPSPLLEPIEAASRAILPGT